MTPFIESFATQQLLPPWQAKDARIWSFAIRLGAKQIQDYLDKYFNGPNPDQAPFQYAPLPGPQFGLVTVAFFPNVATIDRGPGPAPVSGGYVWDRIRHTEVYVSFPVLRYALTEDLIMTKPSLVWVEPVVYSDNDTIVFSSREIWGTDMFLGTIVRDEGLSPDQLHLDLGMLGIKTFDPRSLDQLLAVLHVRALDRSELELPQILAANPDLNEFVDILGGSGVFVGHRPRGVAKDPYPSGVELNNLKQFRDCYNMKAAIYRAIVASRSSYDRVRNVVIYDASKVELDFMWSDSLAEFLQTILGIEKAPVGTGPPPEHAADSCDEIDWDLDRVTLKAELGFAFTADVTFRVLGTIHTYGLAG